MQLQKINVCLHKTRGLLCRQVLNGHFTFAWRKYNTHSKFDVVDVRPELIEFIREENSYPGWRSDESVIAKFFGEHLGIELQANEISFLEKIPFSAMAKRRIVRLYKYKMKGKYFV